MTDKIPIAVIAPCDESGGRGFKKGDRFEVDQYFPDNSGMLKDRGVTLINVKTEPRSAILGLKNGRSPCAYLRGSNLAWIEVYAEDRIPTHVRAPIRHKTGMFQKGDVLQLSNYTNSGGGASAEFPDGSTHLILFGMRNNGDVSCAYLRDAGSLIPWELMYNSDAPESPETEIIDLQLGNKLSPEDFWRSVQDYSV